MKKIDVAILGAGSAGLNARRAAIAEGAKAIMFDPGPLGTTCARVGCMPSKLLIAAAEHVHSAQGAAEFGINIGSIEIDGAAVMARVQRMRDFFVHHTLKGIEKAESGGGLVREYVKLESPNTFIAGGESYEAKSFVIATGSTPWIPPPYRGLGDRTLTTDQIFELKTLPKSMLVVGAGVIGIELALAFARLGVRVAVVDMEGRLAGITDPVVRESAYTIFSEELDLNTQYQLDKVERVGDLVRIRFVDDAGQSRDEEYEYALVAAGRKANTEGWGLQELGMDAANDIAGNVDPATGQLGDSHFFMAGDVTSTKTLLHEAGHEGRVAGQNAARYPQAAVSTKPLTFLGIVFSDPQIATVGIDFDALPDDAIIADVDLVAQSRARVLNRNRGRMRIYASPGDGRLLGATIFGPDAEYLGHLIAWSIGMGATAKQTLEQPYYHPTIVEAVQTGMRKILSQL